MAFGRFAWIGGSSYCIFRTAISGGGVIVPIPTVKPSQDIMSTNEVSTASVNVEAGTTAALAYDAIGNPLTYYNGTPWTMTWVEGRRLATASSDVSMTQDSTTIRTVSNLSFAYDGDGIRTQKVANVRTYLNSVQQSTTTTRHKYITEGGNIVCEQVYVGATLSRELYFTYDESGRPFSLKHVTSSGATTYYYILNLQGDVVGLVDASGTFVAQYVYDAWGNILVSTGDMASINPLRYRGYYYDTETGFYYLQSRYYDPAQHRFINADSLASTGQSMIGTNMFSYCRNNAVNYVDYGGDDAIWIQEPSSAGHQGHSGLVVQDPDGNWYFFYWGPESEDFTLETITGAPPRCIVEKIDTEGYDMTTEEGVVGAIANSKNSQVSSRAVLITDIEYFAGDYTATYDYIVKLKAAVESDPTIQYRLLDVNCMQQTINALSRSNPSFWGSYGVIPNVTYTKIKIARALVDAAYRFISVF